MDALGRLSERLLPPEEAATRTVHGRAAAVLVPVFPRAGEVHAVFTRRRHDLPHHPGEISFPGGRLDPGETLLEAALREADEEIGLASTGVEVLGALEPVSTFVTNFAVHPYVGAIGDAPAWRPSEREVAEVLELSLPLLAAGHGRRRLVRRGVPFRTDTYVVGDHLIWGATARILGDLLGRLGHDVPPWEPPEPDRDAR